MNDFTKPNKQVALPYCWGCVGVTGAFMFYHPKTESYIIGTFNYSSYKSKAIRYMLAKVVRELLSYQKINAL